MLSYISGSASLFFLIWIVSKCGVYHRHYVERSVKFEEELVDHLAHHHFSKRC